MINFLFSLENTINARLLGLPRRWLSQNSAFWIRLFIITGVLFLSATLPFNASQRYSMSLAGLLVGVGVISLFMRWPPLGLLAVICSLIIPYRGPSEVNTALGLVGLLLVLWLMTMMVQKHEIKLVSSRTIPPLLIFVSVAILSFGVGQIPWYPFAQSVPMGAQLGGLTVYILSAGAFLLVAHQVRDVSWLKWMTWLFLILGGIHVVSRLLPGFAQFALILFHRGAIGSLFWVWLVALAFSQALLNRKLHTGWRLVLGGLVVATAYVAYFQAQSWKSGWIPPLFTIIAILGFRFWKLGLLLLPFCVVPALRLISFGIASDEYSYSTRIDAWGIILEMTKVNPILGLGPSAYRWYTPLFPIRGWFVHFNSHSQYVDLIAQTGLLGLACFIWFFGMVIWLGWKLRERVPAGFPRAYVYGALGGGVGTLVAAALGDWVLPFFYNVTLGGFRSSVLTWLFLGGLVALGQIYADRAPVSQKD